MGTQQAGRGRCACTSSGTATARHTRTGTSIAGCSCSAHWQLHPATLPPCCSSCCLSCPRPCCISSPHPCPAAAAEVQPCPAGSQGEDLGLVACEDGVPCGHASAGSHHAVVVTRHRHHSAAVVVVAAKAAEAGGDERQRPVATAAAQRLWECRRVAQLADQCCSVARRLAELLGSLHRAACTPGLIAAQRAGLPPAA